MADVFLSYAREDLPFVRRLTTALQARNREVWVDLEDIIPSARWWEEIRTGITEAHAVAFVISPDSIASRVCRAELDYATEASKRLVPVLARQTPSKGVPSALAELNWLSFLDGTDFEAGVDRMVEVLDTDLDRVHLHTRLLTQAREWERGRDRSLLLRGAELKQAETWLADQTGRKPAATPAQAQLILASRRAATRRQRGIGSTGVVLAVVMAVLAAFALIQWRTAQNERNTAIVNRITTETEQLPATNISLAAQLALTGYRMRPTPDLRTALITDADAALSAPLTDPTGVVNAVAFSPDGHTLASGNGEDDAVRLWNVTDPTHLSLLGKPLTVQNNYVRGVAFSPDRRILVTDSWDHTVRLWNITDPTHPSPLGQPLTGHTNTVFAVAFSPDRRILVTGSWDHTVRLWDITDPTHPTLLNILTGHTGAVDAVTFSPGGHTLASGSYDGTVRLWNVTDPTHPTPRAQPLTGHPNVVSAVAFSPDGQTLATGSWDQTVQLWNVTDPDHPSSLGAPLAGHTNAVFAVAFSPDGHTLATGSEDTTVRLWNITDPTHPSPLGQPLTGHTNTVFAVAFSPDGHTLATGSADHTVRLWGMDVDHAIQRICATTTNNLTPGTWQQDVSPDLPYHPPCP